MGNKGLYSIGKGMWKDTLKIIKQRVSQVIRGLALLAKSNLVKTLQISTCASHVAFLQVGICELVANFSSSPISHTQPVH